MVRSNSRRAGASLVMRRTQKRMDATESLEAGAWSLIHW